MKRNRLKRTLCIPAAISLLVASSFTVQSADSWGYEVSHDENGDIVYELDQLQLTVPSDWDGNYGIVTEERTDTREGSLSLYHLSSRRAVSANDGFNNVGGTFFTLTSSSSYDFMDIEPDYQIIGSSDGRVYYVSRPTDVQGFTDNDKIWNEWSDMCADVGWIIEQIRVLHPGEGIVEWEHVDAADGETLIRDSSEQYLSDSALAGMNVSEMQLAIDEIYARHHCRFTSQAIQKYFDSTSWYSKTADASDFESVSLNQYEATNISLILHCMNQVFGSTEEYRGSSADDSYSGICADSEMQVSADVNIRSSASLSSAIVGIVPRGNCITVLAAPVDGWVLANYHDTCGYIRQEYLSFAPESSEQSAPAGSAAAELPAPEVLR